MVTPKLRRHHDLLHQSVLSILSVWRISAVYQTPCLTVGLFNRSDKSSDTAFRDQSQRAIHLYAALQMYITQRFHSCQGDPISFDFALVHQCVRETGWTVSFPSNDGGPYLRRRNRKHPNGQKNTQTGTKNTQRGTKPGCHRNCARGAHFSVISSQAPL